MRRYQQTRISKSLWIKILLLLLIGLIGFFIAGPLFNESSKPAQSEPSKVQKIDPELHFVTYQNSVKPLMEHYCFDCHGDGSEKGDLDMDRYTNFASMTQDRETWQKIRGHLSLKLMPPVDEEQPDANEVHTITSWIDNTIFYTDPENPDPGKVVIRRLNRNEYKNTIHDLLGVTIDAESLLPLDDTGYGFDTISAVHTVSPAHIEKYLTAAENALHKATVIGEMPWRVLEIPIHQLRYNHNRIRNGRFSVKGTAQPPSSIMQSLEAGLYELQIEASSTAAGEEHAILEVAVDNRSKAKLEIKAGHSHTLCKVKVALKKNTKLTVAFINDFYDPDHPNPALRDRNLRIHKMKLVGPIDKARPQKPASHRNIFPLRTVAQTAEQYALEVWLKFARKAFRRPVEIDEVKPYLRFIDPKESSEEALQDQISLGLQAMLVSPHFLYVQCDPVDSSKEKSLITEVALASRLSYFLWSSAPDEALLEKAEANQLRRNLSKEIDRMLNDPKAKRFVKNFAGQWLQLRDLEVHYPDSKRFPQWGKALRLDAVQETELFIHHLIDNNLSALDCLDSDYSFINRNLAKLYGVKGITGDHFRKVTFSPATQSQRGGLLGHASILTLTSYPDRTSPVLRGKWVLENILATPPPPPPVDIPDLQPHEKHQAHKSLRRQLEDHRKKAECAACHNLLDPLGFALQNYNAIGKWRTRENGSTIDTTGKLITGETINDGKQLRNVLRSNKSDDFMRCLAEKMLTYGLGRGVEYYDKPALDKILRESQTNGHSFRTLIHSVCESVPFQMTRTQNYQAN